MKKHLFRRSVFTEFLGGVSRSQNRVKAVEYNQRQPVYESPYEGEHKLVYDSTFDPDSDIVWNDGTQYETLIDVDSPNRDTRDIALEFWYFLGLAFAFFAIKTSLIDPAFPIHEATYDYRLLSPYEREFYKKQVEERKEKAAKYGINY